MTPRIVIIGGGTAGLTVAARLLRRTRQLHVTVIEPAEQHYYQPYWTLVGGGIVPKEASVRPMADVMPRGVHWLRERAQHIDPDAQQITLQSGQTLSYDALVLAPGIQINWDAIPGLTESLGQGGVCSIYDYRQAERTWDTIRTFTGGNAIFNGAATPVKCGGAPQKIMYLAEENFRDRGVRTRSAVKFYTPGSVIFGVKEYAQALLKVVESRDIDVQYGHTLTRIEPTRQEATFTRPDGTGGTETFTERYDLLHVIPHMSAPDFIRHSPVAATSGPLAGWIETDPYTLQHPRYPQVFALGDAAGLPGHPKTGAAIRKQAPVVVANLLSALLGEPLSARYDGYSSCPLVTGRGKLILAEFVYDNKIKSSYPPFMDSAKERYDAYLLKRHGLPQLYWNGMLQGRA